MVDISSAVMEMAGYLSQQKTDITTEHLDWLYHNIACRSAIKAGDKSSPQELLALVEQLEEDVTIRYCPQWSSCKSCNKEKRFGKTVWPYSVMFSISLFFLHNYMVGY